MSSLLKIRKGNLVRLLAILALFLSVFTGVSLVQRQQEVREAAAATNWYVSKKGNNSDGRSWATAWNKLDRINWSVVQSGDTILMEK